MVDINNTLTDEELMEMYQNDDFAAFETLYSRHEKTVFSYLSKRLKNNDSIEEVFQNTFLKFHKVRKQYNKKYLLMQWLYTITRSELYDYCKKKRIHFEPLTEDHTKHLVNEELSNNNLPDLAKIKSLNEKERSALDLRYFSDKEFKEISQLLNTSPVNARKLVSRGIKKIQLAFKKDTL